MSELADQAEALTRSRCALCAGPNPSQYRNCEKCRAYLRDKSRRNHERAIAEKRHPVECQWCGQTTYARTPSENRKYCDACRQLDGQHYPTDTLFGQPGAPVGPLKLRGAIGAAWRKFAAERDALTAENRALAERVAAMEKAQQALGVVSKAMLLWAQDGQPHLEPPYLDSLLTRYIAAHREKADD